MKRFKIPKPIKEYIEYRIEHYEEITRTLDDLYKKDRSFFEIGSVDDFLNLKYYKELERFATVFDEVFYKLQDREKTIIKSVYIGKTHDTKEMCEELGISPRTVSDSINYALFAIAAGLGYIRTDII